MPYLRVVVSAATTTTSTAAAAAAAAAAAIAVPVLVLFTAYHSLGADGIASTTAPTLTSTDTAYLNYYYYYYYRIQGPFYLSSEGGEPVDPWACFG